MPNVIKSNSVLEDNKNFIINLPEDFFSQEDEQAPSDDDFGFYKNIDIDNNDDESDYKRYFFVKENECETETNKDLKIELELEPTQPLPTEEDLLQEKIDQANQKADEIIELATQRAQVIKQQIEKELALSEEKINIAKSMANNIIDEANKKAQNIINEANKTAEDTLEQAKTNGYSDGERQGREAGNKEGFEIGKQEGFDKGYSEGERKGFIQGQETGKQEGLQEIKNQMEEEIEQATQKAKDILLQSEIDYKKKLDSMNEKIVDLVMSVASRVLNKQIDENPFLILQMVKEAAKKVIEQPRLFININSQNYDIVFASCNEIKKELGSKQELSVVVDNSLGLADVVITTGGSGDVDARLETQMNQVRKAIEAVII